MGQCYSVYIKMNVLDEKGAIKALQDKISRGDEEYTNYSLEHYRDEQGIGTDTLQDLLKIFFGGWEGNLKANKRGELEAHFDASYGWEGVMLTAFNELAPHLADGSKMKIYPDSGVDICVVKKGKVVRDESARTGKWTRVHLAFVPDCGENEGGWYVEIYKNIWGDPFDNFCIHPGDCDCSNMDEVMDYARRFVSTIQNY